MLAKVTFPNRRRRQRLTWWIRNIVFW